jgi:hypothetical protein
MGVAEGFDVMMSAGNAMMFLYRDICWPALSRMAAQLRDARRLAIGFDPDTAARSWDLRPSPTSPASSSPRHLERTPKRTYSTSPEKSVPRIRFFASNTRGA